MAKIVVTHGIPRAGFASLAAHTVVIPAQGEAFSHDALMRLIPDADAVIACGALESNVIRAGTRLRIISNYGAGYDGVDVDEAARCGIPVTNIPDVTAQSTAELTMALMLSVTRRVSELSLRMRREAPETLFGMGHLMGRSLAGRRLGIVGMGQIGGIVAELASSFGMKVSYYNRHRPAQEHGATRADSLSALVRTSDILSLHCPLTQETRGMVNREVLAMLPEGAVVINTARGAVVDLEALADALESGHLTGAGIDVFPEEPHVPRRLLQCERAVLTPHTGVNTEETRSRMAAACAEKVLTALSGREPSHVVNPSYRAHSRL